jgi:hypothetical protein
MDKIGLLNNSRMARAAYALLKEYLDKQRKDLLARLLAQTKVGPVDPQIYAKFLGGIASLDELEGVIRREILKGEPIEKELLNASQRNPGGPSEGT